MSMRTADRQADSSRWHKGQSAELVNGTIGIVVCFALVCLFLIAMAR
jgi:hypothetical protein